MNHYQIFSFNNCANKLDLSDLNKGVYFLNISDTLFKPVFRQSHPCNMGEFCRFSMTESLKLLSF